jgi:hypothetical protein
MAPKPYPSNGTDWSAWSLGDLEKRAVEYADWLSPEFKRALAAARRKYEVPAARVQRRPTAWGGQVWGPLPDTRDAHLMWDGPGDGLMFYAVSPDKPEAIGRRVEHRAVCGTFQKLAEADRMARRFIAIGLDDLARAEPGTELDRQEAIAADWHARVAAGRGELGEVASVD